MTPLQQLLAFGALVAPLTGLVGFAVYRFTKLETVVEHRFASLEEKVGHNHHCQQSLIKAVLRLKRQVDKVTK